MNIKKRGLGRGLDALLGSSATKVAVGDTPGTITEIKSDRNSITDGQLRKLPLDIIQRGQYQPRIDMHSETLDELAESIRVQGVIQPIVVRPIAHDKYEIIAGERRWRAARLAGLRTIPAVIRERLADGEQLEVALVENLQRQDLTPLEEARAFEDLRTSLGLSQAEIAERVAMDRSTVANSLRLLRLPPEVQELVERGDLSAGHGRTLLAFDGDDVQCEWARRVVATGVSVRELERVAAAARAGAGRKKKVRPGSVKDPNLFAAEGKLALRLGAPVEIQPRRRGGRIIISCSNQDEMVRVYDFLMGGE